MTDGKNAVGLKGFPTPNNAAGVAGYLLFLLEDKTYAQWILGGLEALGYAYNWYKSGELDVDEAAELFRGIVQEAPYNLKACANPDGGRILRVSPTGRVEELSDANEWVDPTGDYEIPPVPARTDGSPTDQICLAAKNAANVLETLYEDVTDSFNDGLSTAEAQTALTLSIIALIGAEFAPITFALVTFFGIVFSTLYGLLGFIGADLWTSDFTEALVCILVDCASNDDGVVTFDYECFNEKLAAQVTIVPLTFDQLRLFGQIQYLLLVIGGVDALNHAGATTAITDDDCSFCDPETCSEDTNFSDGDLHGWEILAGRGTPTVGVGLVAVWNGSYEELEFDKGCPGGGTLVDLRMDYNFPNVVSFSIYIFNSTLTTVEATLLANGSYPAGSDELHIPSISFNFDAGQLLLIDITSGNNDGASIGTITTVFT